MADLEWEPEEGQVEGEAEDRDVVCRESFLREYILDTLVGCRII